MKKSSVYFLFLGVFLLFNACKSSKDIKIEETNYKDEIDQQQNLVFKFNHDLVPDSMLNVWEQGTYINFEPKVEGKFRWESKNTLVFSPTVGFAPSTDYTATLSKDLSKYSSEKRSISSDEKNNIKFHTPYLSLLNSDVFWTKVDQRTAMRININFNYKVNPTEITRLLKLSVDNKNLEFTLKNASPSETVEISVWVNNNDKYDTKILKTEIEKGLKCSESSYVSTEPMSIETEIPSKDKFKIAQILPEYEEEKGFIHVYCNQAPDKNQDFKQLISCDPYVNFQVEILEYGFILKGDFRSSMSYNLTLAGKMRGLFGGTLEQDFQQVVMFGDLNPSVSFSSKKAIYLTSQGLKNLGLRIINLPSVEVKVYKIYENNILHFLRESYVLNNGEDDYYSEYYGTIENYGDLVYSKVIGTKEFRKNNGLSLLNLDLNDTKLLKGIYMVEVSSADERYLRATKVLSISDIGLIVKKGDDEITVFANSILSTKAISGATVNLISSNNQQVYKAETNGDGVAVFKEISKKAPGFNINMITAELDVDFTYLHFQQTTTDLSKYEISGVRYNPGGYQAFIYGDRNIYRPGETVHANTIVRNDSYEPMADLPIKIKILAPTGGVFKQLKAVLNEQGAYNLVFNLPVGALTGMYSIEVYTSNDVLVNSASLNVEEFIPDRISVKMNLEKSIFKLTDKLKASATAMNLFGPPASDRNYEIQMQLERKQFNPKDLKGYNFTISGGVSDLKEQDLRQGKTNDEGKAIEEFTFPSKFANNGMLLGKVFTTVFDESGRPVNRLSVFDLATQDNFIGIYDFERWNSTRQNMSIGLAAVNHLGQLINNAKARVLIVRYNWQSVLQKDDYGRFTYASEKREVVVSDKNYIVNGKSTVVPFVPNLSGEYAVRVYIPNSDSYVEREFYAYGYGNSSASFEVDPEGEVTIEYDKQKYEVGESAKVLFKTPFDGRMLVTIERNKLFEHRYVDVSGKSATIEIDIEEDYLPNVYVSATLMKAMSDNSSNPLTVAHGFVAMNVEKKAHRLPVEIKSVTQSRSNTKQTICVKSNPESDIEVTLAVVDEGILQLKNFQTPDPHEFFFRKRGLDVISYDIYPRLFPELRPSKASYGADGYNMDKRVNPLTNKRVNLIAFWSGHLHTNGDGEAFYTINIPQFSGDLRIMAAAYKDKAFGSAFSNMKVSDPLVISSGIPRFLSPKDDVLIPVTLTNTTKNPGTATAKMFVSNGLTVEESSQSATLKPNSETRIWFKVSSKAKIGEEAITVSVNALGESFTEKTNITIRPAASLTKNFVSGELSSGQSKEIKLANEYMPLSTAAKLVVTKSPMAKFTKNLSDLIQYPYGCVEQTVSAVFPQLYLKDISKSLKLNIKNQQNSAFYVQEAIKKLNTMQLYNGSLSYWQGGDYESWWGSAFAAHFMIEARKAGYEIDGNVLDKILVYLNQKVKEKKTETLYYSEVWGSVYKNKTIISKEVAYSLYVLGLGGRADVSTMNYCKSNSNMLAIDSRYLLAASYLLIGDRSNYKSVMPTSFAKEISANSLSGSFYSYIRDEAVALNALIDVDPNSPQVAIMTRHLSEQMSATPYLNTQENVFAMLAMGKMSVKANKSTATASVWVNGKQLASGDNIVLKSKDIEEGVQIKTAGVGTIYYYYEQEGIPSDGKVKEEDKFIKVRKTFLDRNGKVISGRTFNQNDLIVIKLSVSTTDGRQLENIATSDLLPAGFEIENPRITNSPDMNWIDNAATPDYFDVRDDRIHFFGSASGVTKNYYYQVRAVTKGSFVMGAASADAMYNGEYHSYNGAGIVEIK